MLISSITSSRVAHADLHVPVPRSCSFPPDQTYLEAAAEGMRAYCWLLPASALQCCTAVADLGAGTCLAEASSGVLGELVPFQAAVSYFSVQHQQFDHCLITSLPFLLCLLVCICSKVSLWSRRHVLNLRWPAVRSTCSISWKILRHLSCSGACWGMQTGQCFGGPLSALQCISAVGRPSHHVCLWNDNGWGQQLFRGHGSTALVHPCIYCCKRCAPKGVLLHQQHHCKHPSPPPLLLLCPALQL